MTPDQIAAACPLRIDASARAGCCDWQTFLDGFADAWPRWFSAPPTIGHWRMAKRDWRSGNTGWEAAHNTQSRAKDRVARQQGEDWEKSGAAVLLKISRGERL